MLTEIQGELLVIIRKTKVTQALKHELMSQCLMCTFYKPFSGSSCNCLYFR